MIRRLCARLSFALLGMSIALVVTANGASASGAGGCDGDHVVVLDQRVNSRAGSRTTVQASFPTTVPAGTYEITVVTSDGYEGRSNVTQTEEQVVVTLGDVSFGPTPDLADGEDHASATATGRIELSQPVDAIVVSHASSNTGEHNSVDVGCVGLRALGSSPPVDDPPPAPDPPPMPAPVPTCVGDHVATFGRRLDSRAGTSPSSLRAPFDTPVAAGTYDITVVTFDAYERRAVVTQPNEQVVVSLGDVTFGPTTDLADAQPSATATTTGRVELTQAVDVAVARHLLSGTPDNNSVSVGCVSLTLVDPAPPPPPAPVVEVTVAATCAPRSGVVVEIRGVGRAVAGVVGVDGVATPIEILAASPTTVVVPAEPGVRTVVVEVDGTVEFDGETDVACSVDDPGDGLGDPPGGSDPDPGDTPGGGDAPGAGDGSGQPGTGGGNGEEPGAGGGDPVPSNPPPSPTTPPAVPPPAPPTPLGFVPELTLRVACADRTIEASVGNVGDTVGSVTLAIAPSARSVAAEIAPASTTTVALPLPADAEGRTTEVVLVTETGEVLTGTAAVDCLSPAVPVAQVSVDCATGTVTVVVRNTGGEVVAVRAFAEQVALLGSTELAGGDEVRYEVDIAGSTVPLRIVAEDGTDILREEITHTCRQDDVRPELSLVCPAETLELTLTNDAAEPRTVTIHTAGKIETVEIDGGAEVVLVRSLAETPAVRVVSAYGDVLLDETLDGWACDPSPVDSGCADVPTSPRWVVAPDGEVAACSGVQARVVVDCASGTGVIEIANGTDRPEVVVVRRDGVVVAEPSVAVGEIVAVPISDVAGVHVTAAVGGERLLDTVAACETERDRTAAVLSGLLVALMSIVAIVVARVDPWIRV